MERAPDQAKAILAPRVSSVVILVEEAEARAPPVQESLVLRLEAQSSFLQNSVVHRQHFPPPAQEQSVLPGTNRNNRSS
jgi:hypothetical protein